MKRRMVLALALAMAAGAAWLAGCTPSTELEGAAIPNSRPDTRITGQPPSIIEAGFVVSFYWTGDDPDGRIAGYQWKISNNGTDGISVRDTLTFDPATGDTVNPWHFTTVTDTTFIVSADIPDYPPDPEGDARSFETHTLWVRAVDDEGAVDPSPAHISFTSLTLLPTVIVDTPVSFFGQASAKRAPQSATFGWTGNDPDWELGTPTQVRTLFKNSYVEGVGYVATRAAYNLYREQLITFDDPAWSAWFPYAEEENNRRQTYPGLARTNDQGELIRYLFAVQAQDTAGAVSVDLEYGVNVVNCYVSTTLTPQLVIFEPFLLATPIRVAGTEGTRAFDIASQQPLNFSWSANADDYAGEIASYRFGWDVAEVDNPEDPGWAISPGLTPQHLFSPTTVFDSGVHTLTIEVLDNSDQLTRYQFVLNVVPVPDPVNQRPVLLIDDILDRNSQLWPSQDGLVRYDQDVYRDAFWEEVLGAISGGVDGFFPNVDVIDSEESIVKYRQVVDYRVLLWYVKWVSSTNNAVVTEFRPEITGNNVLRDFEDKFNWLAPYQEQVGNLLFAGSRAMNSFLAERNYMVPIVFDSTERFLVIADEIYVVGFGDRELPNGLIIQNGPDRYPYRVLGVSWIDQMSPVYHLYGRAALGRNDRQAACVGMKALLLDPDFRSLYQPAADEIPDTLWTESRIDWQTLNPTGNPSGPAESYLETAYGWGVDEFYDQNIADRPTALNIQLCEDGAETRPCIVPMFHALSRYDWFRTEFAAIGDTAWPFNMYGNTELLEICGEKGLDLAQNLATARTNGTTVGFVSIKTRENKPSGKGDVIWGFDPYRFDWTQITRTVRWVLSEHFGLVLRP